MKILTQFVSLIFLCLCLLSSKGIKGKYKIEVILSSDNTIYEQGLYGIRTVTDSDIHVSYLDIITSENPDITTYFSKLETEKVSLIVAIGPAAARLSKANVKSIPIVFSMVNSPKSLGLTEGNTCGVSMDISINEYFKTLKDIDPNIRNVISFYSTTDGEQLAGEGEYNDLKYRLFYNKAKVENINEFEAKLETIKVSTQAFYMVNDPLYNKTRFEVLSNFCKKNKIVLMTSFPTLVKLGATFAISPDYSKIGVLTGNMINRILYDESSCKQEGVVLPDQSSLYVNKEYSEASGIVLPEVVLERARLTRLFTVGVNLMNEEKYKSAKIVFETILKRDPQNASAESYLQLVIEKLTKSKTDEILASADKHFQGKNFSLAATEYQSVLKLNPNISIAKERYKESILGQSELQRAQAANFVKNGDPFTAIKTYQAAIATLPTNNKATSELAALRVAETRKIPVYLNNGIDEYNKRNYESAIIILQNILLVDGQNKQATEYLRLSTKKQEAIQRLKKKLNK